MQTLDQDEDEEFANLVKKLAGDFDKDIASSMPTVDVCSISRCQEIRKEILKNMKTQLPRLWMYQAMKT